MYKDFVPGTSRGARSLPTLALRMATVAERQREVGARLRELRGARPQPLLADAIGVTLRAYQAWEAGESGIAWRNLHALAEYHDVSENFLLYGDEKPEGAGSQLDRIEAKLDKILGRLGPTDAPPLTEMWEEALAATRDRHDAAPDERRTPQAPHAA
jgi:transcriptional regulator with XRE-family HTH domain